MHQRSFLKWVGGKYRSLSQVLGLFPKEFDVYYEPFMGSGVVYFNLVPPKGVLNDVESSLVTTFRSVKRNAEGVCDALDLLENGKEAYYSVRYDFNNASPMVTPKRAAQFIYMNKCGYNGLYRVNKRGYINVAFGHREGDPHKDFETVRTCSKLLQSASVMNADYRDVTSLARGGDFVYLDPPYHKELPSSFTGYNSQEFSEADHRLLAEECKALSQRGVLFALSNSNTQFVNDLYKNFYKFPIYTARTVSRMVERRGRSTEILITNYKAPRE
jgi:DNA adenine methylase